MFISPVTDFFDVNVAMNTTFRWIAQLFDANSFQKCVFFLHGFTCAAVMASRVLIRSNFLVI